jgi:hypothetical protein
VCYFHSHTLFVSSLLYRRHAEVQLLEALRYKPEGLGFDSQ